MKISVKEYTMKKVILGAVFAAMVITTFSGCGEDRNDGFKERKQDYKKPDINRPGDTKRYENF